MSQWQPITMEKCHSGNLWDRKPELWCHATAGEGSLHDKNAHQICCVKKLHMTQAQSFKAHPPGGFKFINLVKSTNLLHMILLWQLFQNFTCRWSPVCGKLCICIWWPLQVQNLHCDSLWVTKKGSVQPQEMNCWSCSWDWLLCQCVSSWCVNPANTMIDNDGCGC